MSSYKIINLLLAGVILVIFIYSSFFFDTSMAVACIYKATAGIECSACGLTRDFNSFLALKFESPINANSWNVFLFFAIQLFARIALLVSKQEYIWIDIILSTLAFLVAFVPFL